VPGSPEALAQVTNQATALAAVRAAADNMTQAQRDAGLLEMFAEQAIGRVATVNVTGTNVVINQATISAVQNVALNARSAIRDMLWHTGPEFRRDINPVVTFVVPTSQHVDITIEPSSRMAAVQHIRVRTPYYEVAFTPAFIASEVSAEPLFISVTSSPTLYTVSVSRALQDSFRLAVSALPGDVTHQALRRVDGIIASGRHNPTTNRLETRVRESGQYTVIFNPVEFNDIGHLPWEMQQAIRSLASQGIVSGTGGGRFSPNESITRAQMSALTMGMLGRLDPNAGSAFVDVNRSDWFFGAVGSANRHGLMQGVGSNRFAPNTVMPRDQMVALSARVLRTEMGYAIPTNPALHLALFHDRGNIPTWGHGDISLAVRERLVPLRGDNMFLPAADMSRGDAALMLYRVFNRIW